jgi:predicted AlkP superfamily phosphohydrolase/phosphomutase
MDTLVVGIDGGEWDVIDPLIASGRLPNLAKLKRDGVSGPLVSTVPPVSPLAWNSIQTGTNPGKHGVYDFISFDEEYRRRSVNSTDRRSVPFWHVLNDHDTTTGLFKIPFTYPPDEVSGYMVTGFPTPNSVDDFVEPASLGDHVGPVEDLFEDESLKRTEGLEAFRDDLIAVAEHQTDVFCDLLERVDTEFGMTVYDGSDRIQHFFWKYFDDSHPRYEPDSELADAIEQYYETIDEGIGRILDRTPDDCDVLVLSDHGFGPLADDVYVDEWLNREGFLVRRPESPQQSVESTLGSVIETAWAAVRRTGQDERIKSILPGSLIDFRSSVQDVRTRDFVWEETEVFFTTLSGQSFMINLEDRFSEGTVPPERYDEVVGAVTKSLLSVRHPETGESLVRDIYHKDDIFHGWAAAEAPDLVARTNPQCTLKSGRSESLVKAASQQGAERSGDHRPDGVLVASGPSFDEGRIEESHVTDIAPTLLHLHGAPVPASMDGRVLADLFPGSGPSEAEIHRATEYGEAEGGNREWSDDEETELEDRLNDLGYLG